MDKRIEAFLRPEYRDRGDTRLRDLFAAARDRIGVPGRAFREEIDTAACCFPPRDRSAAYFHLGHLTLEFSEGAALPDAPMAC